MQAEFTNDVVFHGNTNAMHDTPISGDPTITGIAGT